MVEFKDDDRDFYAKQDIRLFQIRDMLEELMDSNRRLADHFEQQYTKLIMRLDELKVRVQQLEDISTGTLDDCTPQRIDK